MHISKVLPRERETMRA
jgi:hypothetical protein